jgi:hypothetical protein
MDCPALKQHLKRVEIHGTAAIPAMEAAVRSSTRPLTNDEIVAIGRQAGDAALAEFDARNR